MRKIDKVVIHHSLTSKNISIKNSIASFDRTHAQRLHPEKNGYGYHIAYHFVIGGKGEIIKTRPLEEIGYHASNWPVNQSSIGICLCGNFDVETPNPEQLKALKALIIELSSGLKFGAKGIFFHKDFAPKTCPGKNMDINVVKGYIEKEHIKIPVEDSPTLPLNRKLLERLEDRLVYCPDVDKFGIVKNGKLEVFAGKHISETFRFKYKNTNESYTLGLTLKDFKSIGFKN